MAIKTNSGNVKHIYVKDKGYATETKKSDGTIIWEEYVGTYTPGTLPTGVTSLSCYRTSKDPAVGAGTIASGAALYNKDVLTFTPSPIPYYTVNMKNSSYTVSAAGVSSTSRESSFNGASLSGPTASPIMRNVTFNLTGCTVGVSYYVASGSQKSATMTSSQTASVWAGQPVVYSSVQAKSGYAFPNSSASSGGTIAAGYDAVTRTIAAYPYEWKDICSTNSSDSDSSSSSSVTNIWKPGGLAGYEKVRVSGTVTITLKSSSYGSTTVTTSFSNVQLAAPNSSTTLGSWTGPSSYGAPPYGSITMYHSNALSCSAVLSYSGTAGYSISGLSVNVTNIQVYVPFDAEQFLDVWNEDTMQFSSNIYPGYAYAVGDIEGSSSDESLNFSSTSFTQAVSEQISSDTAYTVSLTEGAITAADAYFAVSLTKGGYMVTTMFNGVV